MRRAVALGGGERVVIAARKQGVPSRVLDGYVGWKVRRAFRGLWMSGRLPPADRPLLVYANHPGFWDGFVAHQVCRAAGWDGYCLMEERQLARYRFLARLGAFSIRRGDPRSALESLRYAARLLRRPGAAVVVFPEGELRPIGTGRLALERGVEVLGRLAPRARCVPLAVRYAFFEHELPDVLVVAGDAHAPAGLEDFARRLAAVTARVAAARSTSGFVPLVRGRRSVAERWDAVRGLPAGA
jgi:hypothetical protein